METRTLGSRREGTTDTQTLGNFTVFITLFATGLAHRLPTDRIEDIDVSDVEKVARLSAICTPIVVEAWNEFSQNSQQVRGQRRAA